MTDRPDPGYYCKSCRFSELDEIEPSKIQCHRFPPTRYDPEDDIWLWPEVWEFGRCGEWKPRDGEDWAYDADGKRVEP